jgi:O-acetylhomoserine/O-acetylserine sulfhydrylase-like pyridoxal-dependent enzyme
MSVSALHAAFSSTKCYSSCRHNTGYVAGDASRHRCEGEFTGLVPNDDGYSKICRQSQTVRAVTQDLNEGLRGRGAVQQQVRFRLFQTYRGLQALHVRSNRHHRIASAVTSSSRVAPE